MIKKMLGIIAAGCLLTSQGAAWAGETDVLIQKLVEKGVLTPSEAQIVSDETKQEVAKQNAKGTNDAIPTWVQNTKIKGDLRVRYEWRKDKNAQDLSRERLRLRTGIETKVNDQLKVGVGIATGKSSDPRSRNATFGNDAQTSSTDYTPGSGKSIILDYAYAEYTPIKFATIIAGKFQNPLWNPYDMLWKGDITPEGFAVKLNYDVNRQVQLFMNDLAFVLRNNDSADAKHPAVFAFQPGVNVALTDTVGIKAAATYYKFTSLKNQPKFSYSSNTNTTYTSNGLTLYTYNYDALQLSAELAAKQLLGAEIPFGYGALFGDYILNVSAAADRPTTGRSGYDTGVKFGYEKVADWKQWQGKLTYSRLEKDAWVDAFTDSDRYSGKTNTRSMEANLDFGLGKNTWLSLDYYYSTLLTKTNGNNTPEQLLQVDWNMKW